jgi:hypothetical protein
MPSLVFFKDQQATTRTIWAFSKRYRIYHTLLCRPGTVMPSRIQPALNFSRQKQEHILLGVSLAWSHVPRVLKSHTFQIAAACVKVRLRLIQIKEFLIGRRRSDDTSRSIRTPVNTTRSPTSVKEPSALNSKPRNCLPESFLELRCMQNQAEMLQ